MRTVLQNLKGINGESIDIIMQNGRIVEITKPFTGTANKAINCSDIFVSSGWIDMHVHAFPYFKPYGDEADKIGYQSGVTTLIDAGSCGANDISRLSELRNKYKTNLFAFLNISKVGLNRTDELSNLDWVNEDIIKTTLKKYPDLIVGLKARMSASVIGSNGLKPLDLARKIADETKQKIMTHIGSSPPNIKEILPYLKNDDIITHYLNGKENNLFSNNSPIPDFIEAINRGVQLDVGHGTSSFSFHMADLAKKHNIIFNTISTDIYQYNRLNGPVYNMATTLTKFLSIGYSLEKVIDAVTINPARWLGKPELGRIRVGDLANLTLFKILNKEMTLTDSYGQSRKTNQVIVTKGVVINGEVIL